MFSLLRWSIVPPTCPFPFQIVTISRHTWCDFPKLKWMNKWVSEWMNKWHLHDPTSSAIASFLLPPRFFCSKTSHKKLLNMLFPTFVLPLSLKFTPLRHSSRQIAKKCLINVFPHLYQVKSEEHQVLIFFGQSAAPGIVGDSLFKGFKKSCICGLL